MGVFLTSNGNFKLRIRISSTLQPYFNKLEINKNLGTKKLSKAKIKASIILAKYNDLKRLSRMLDKETIQKLVNKFIIESLEQDLKERARDAQGLVKTSYYEDEPYRNTPALASADMASMLMTDYMEALGNADYKLIKPVADEVLEKENIQENNNSDSYKLFCYYMSLAQIELLKEVEHRGLGGIPNEPLKISNELFKTQQPIQAQPQSTEQETTSDNNKKLITHKEAVDKYLSYYVRKGKAKGTSEQQLQEVSKFFNEFFLSIIDKDKPLDSMTYEHVLDAIDTIKTLPKRNIQKYRRMSIEELLNVRELPENERITKATINKLIKWIKAFYKFCSDFNYMKLNFSDYLSTINNNKNAQDERLALTNNEIKRLLELTEDKPIMQNMVKVFYTSGMRLSELEKCEVKMIDGVWVYDLLNTKEKLKTSSSHRVIPIHDSVDISMLDKDKLPTSDNFSKTINELIRTNISTDKRKVLYSLRHSFATILKHKMVNEIIISELMGHSQKGMTFIRYAERYPVSKLKEVIDLINIYEPS